MPQLIYESTFQTLRSAYLEVRNFLEKESGIEISTIHTKISNDLGFDGGDCDDLIGKFITTYHLGTTGFDISQHFFSEGEISNSGTAFLVLISLPIVVFLWLMKIVTFGKLNWTNIQLIPEYGRPVKDMTFGDMLTWYLMGDYRLREEVKVALIN